MSNEEERLAQLLKRVVPEPPGQLAVDQITAKSPARPAARGWLTPTLAAAAVAVIGVTVGLVAAERPDHSPPPTKTALPSAGHSAASRPSPQVTCPGRTVTVPNVIGVTSDAAMAIIQDAGLNVGIYYGVPAAGSGNVPDGSVVTQSLAAGSKAVPGAEVVIELAATPSTSTAPDIDPGFIPTASPTPPSPCQPVTGTPAPSNATVRVPIVVGMPSAQAVEVARAAGFSVSTVTAAAPAAGPPVPGGTVFAQSPPAGSTAMPRTGMIVYVAR